MPPQQCQKPPPIQQPGLPRWPTDCDQALAVAPRGPGIKRRAELESAVKILEAKLDYTERKIMESQNNKELLKARLDRLIRQLTAAGYDPNLKADRPAKLTHQKPRQPRKTEESKVKAIQPAEPDFKAVLAPLGNNRPPKVTDESWEKLLSLANEYERRLNIVKSLEEQEKLVKHHLKTSQNTPLSEVMDVQQTTAAERR